MIEWNEAEIENERMSRKTGTTKLSVVWLLTRVCLSSHAVLFGREMVTGTVGKRSSPCRSSVLHDLVMRCAASYIPDACAASWICADHPVNGRLESLCT